MGTAAALMAGTARSQSPPPAIGQVSTASEIFTHCLPPAPQVGGCGQTVYVFCALDFGFQTNGLQVHPSVGT